MTSNNLRLLFTKANSKLEFVLDTTFQFSLMFVGKAKSLTYSGAPEKALHTDKLRPNKHYPNLKPVS